MTVNGRLSLSPSSFGGYRLHKLEVLNWGTFDGEVYSVRPAGSSALLVGQNGSGKSTLVDALLTLLVRPGVRNFNVAAGGKKRERDERSYIRGAFDRGSDESGDGIEVKFLRPRGEQYSVILAWFHNEDISKSFSIAQLLYLGGDQSVEKIYCFSEGERSIQSDFGGLESSDGILKTLRQRGFQATRTFHEFERWFTRLTHVKPKAMEVFNQTVAVKDIEKLNDFIRDHMLEHSNWDEKVDGLLGHFTELSDAHESLVRVRIQRDLLEPVAKSGEDFCEHRDRLARAEGILGAIEVYFSQKTIELFSPILTARREELTRTQETKEALSTSLTSLADQIGEVKNEINRAGGERLQQIPRLIEIENIHLTNKRRSRERFVDALATLGVDKEIETEAEFSAIVKQLPELRERIEKAAVESNSELSQAILGRGALRQSLSDLQQELAGLAQRRDNIPQWCVALRTSLCTELGVAEREFPFAAELIRVDDRERHWEGSIEKVLRSFALSMLVPDRFYDIVAGHLDRSRLTHAGRGQRLVYLRVSTQPAGASGAAPRSRSLLRKLVLRQGHPLLPWVSAELAHRFDYECCEDVQEFQAYRGLAMTINRHVKSGPTRHEKDDRDQALDPRHFVLGWDNREKKLLLANEIERLTADECAANEAITTLESRLENLRRRTLAIAEAARVASFDDIDLARHQREIEELEKDQRALENKSSAIKALKTRLNKLETQEAELTQRRDSAVARERELDNEIKFGDRLVANSQRKVEVEKANGGFQKATRWFPDLDNELADPPLTSDDCAERKDAFRAAQDKMVARLRTEIDPVQRRLLDSMSKYLRYCPEDESDLQPSVDYLDGFLSLQRRIEEDDLPRHEKRFKDRLNQKVIEEIGLFRNALDQERRGIEDKIELLNVSLKKLPYRPGTHIQLEPRPIRDSEITDFQGRLRECIEGSFDNSAEANEARFVRIRDLIQRLRDETNRRWRDKVTDVRRWFDFLAVVIDRETQKPVSIYQDSSGQSGGEKAKLAFTILVAAIAYQYDLDPEHPVSDRFHFVVVDEMFSKVDDPHAEYALNLFKQFGLQLLIVAPLDAKARVTQPYVGSYLHVVKRANRSAIYEMTAREFEHSILGNQPFSIATEFSEA